MQDHADSCSEIRAHLPLYVGGDLDDAVLSSVAQRLVQHLQGCEACGEALEAAEAARSALIGIRTPAGPDLWPGLRDRLRTEGLFASGRTGRAAESAMQEPRDERATGTGEPRELPAPALVPGPAPRPLFRRSLLSGLGTVAAAAAIAALVWIGGGPAERPADLVQPAETTSAATPATTLAPSVASNDATSDAATGLSASATPIRRTQHPIPPEALAGASTFAGDSPFERSILSPVSIGRPVPTMPQGNRVPSNAFDPSVERPRQAGLHRVAEGEERLLVPQQEPQVRGVRFFVRPIMAEPDPAPAPSQPNIR